MSAYKTITTDTAIVGTTLSFPNRVTVNNLPTGTANSCLITNVSGVPSYNQLPASTISVGADENSLWTSASTTQWLGRNWRYGIYFARFNTLDWNSAATVSATFGSATSNFSKFGPNTFTWLTTQVAGTSLLCNTTGYYRISVTACLTNGGATPASIRFNVLINGVATGIGPACTIAPGDTQTLSGIIPIQILATQVISFQSTRLNGTTGAATVDTLNSQFLIDYLQIIG